MPLDELALQRIRRMIPQQPTLTRDLAFMAKYKYDSYEVYSTGKKFLPSLAHWIGQFDSTRDMETALILVSQLLFLSRREMLELSRVTYQRILQELIKKIIIHEELQPFEYSVAYNHLIDYLRKCVFIGMSDGAQIDYFRRHSNEMIEEWQVLPYYKVDEEEKTSHSGASFAFLLDDMSASGLTFLRKENGKPTGQLPRFLRKWKDFVTFDTIYFCPYVITESVLERLRQEVPEYLSHQRQKTKFEIIYGMKIPKSYNILNENSELPAFKGKVGESNRRRVIRLCEKYYDSRVENPATRKGGGCKFGFGQAGILLVRYNNTPNNTPSIVWYSGPNEKPPALFKRLVRHKL